MTATRRPFDLLRRAFVARRGLALAAALALGVVQFALQSHLVEHDALAGPHEVCEQCVVAKSVAPPPALDAALPAPLRLAPAPALPAAPVLDGAPLVVRNRAPPSLA